ncbi:MAG: hypothetical protein ABIU54_03205 [Candidatus Eisenbacteria bacterium]
MRCSPIIPLLALCAIPFACGSAGAQGFHAVTSKDGVDVWAVGDSGRVFRSLDAGASYAPGSLGNKSLRGVAHVGFHVLVVGDSGKVWHSSDNGGAFAIQVIPGTPTLRAVVMPAPNVAFAAGDAGTLLRSGNFGATWTSQTSGTSERLNGLSFTDSLNGWACGTAGMLLHTVNGGASWAPVASSTTQELFGVSQRNNGLWVVGANSALLKGSGNGLDLAPVRLRADAQPDVRAVSVQGAGDVWLAGGGGFLRHTQDGGLTWAFAEHVIHAQLSAVAFAGGNGFAVSNRNRAVLHSTGGGAWTLQSGATVSRTWQQVRSTPGANQIRGSTLTVNPKDKRTMYVVLGNVLYRSRDEGETWATLNSGISTIDRTNAFVISPKDTNIMLIAAVTTGGTRQVLRSVDGGLNWTSKLTHAFGEYGIPLEVHPDKPDTVYFGGDADKLYRSFDFGDTWASFGAKSFRSPCDIVVLPDSANIIQVGDGITGSGIGELLLSTDSGQTFAKKQNANNSEVPGMASGRLRNSFTLATNWSGAGVRATSDYGQTWPLSPDLNVAGQNVTSSWGCDISKDDPNVMIVGQYSGGQTYISLDGGAIFDPVPLAGTNYSFYARDRGTIFAEEQTGVFKMRSTYAYTPVSAQSVTVTSPNGGESWSAGSIHAITWNAVNLGLARIEWRRSSSDAWQKVALVEGYLETYAWTVPAQATTTAEVRVRDAWDTNPSDSSNAVFTILSSGSLSLIDPNGGEQWQYGTTHPVAWSGGSVDSVVLEYRTSPDSSWLSLAGPLAAGTSPYAWVIPDAPTAAASVRVRDKVSVFVDASAAPFSILVPRFAAAPEVLEMGSVDLTQGGSGVLTINNIGTAPLGITLVSSDNPRFTPGRSSLVVAAGGQDTLGVDYSPVSAGADSALLTFTADDPAAPHTVRVRALAGAFLAVGDSRPVAFALSQNAPNPFIGRTVIRFAVPRTARITLEVFDLGGRIVATLVDRELEAGSYSVPFGSGTAGLEGQRIGRMGSGVYFYRLRAPGVSLTKRLLVLP